MPHLLIRHWVGTAGGYRQVSTEIERGVSGVSDEVCLETVAFELTQHISSPISGPCFSAVNVQQSRTLRWLCQLCASCDLGCRSSRVRFLCVPVDVWCMQCLIMDDRLFPVCVSFLKLIQNTICIEELSEKSSTILHAKVNNNHFQKQTPHITCRARAATCACRDPCVDEGCGQTWCEHCWCT